MAARFFYRSKVRRLIDVVASPLTWAGALLFKYFRNDNGHKMPLTKKILLKKGIFPVRDHYEEPLFNTKKHLGRSLRVERKLPGINLNTEEQLALLDSFNFNE